MDKTLILDFGSQFTQLIARRMRELGVYSEIQPASISLAEIKSFQPNAIILSGGPFSVTEAQAPQADAGLLGLNVPILGVCYGMQWLANSQGGRVEPARSREYGFTIIQQETKSKLFQGLPESNWRTWMSHGDEVEELPDGFQALARSQSGSLAAMGDDQRRMYAVQFHPEVTHTDQGTKIFENFLQLAEIKRDWSVEDFAKIKEQEIHDSVGPKDTALCALSGGVDSTVAATMVEQAIPGRLLCLHIDHGLQREGETEEIISSLKETGLNVTSIDASEEFLSQLKGVTDPEKKRKIIGKTFIDVFEREAKKLGDLKWMVQGTLYPDVIESVPPPGRGGYSATIKSHHNVGGLPEKMHLKLIEPLRELFKDEVRKLGRTIGVPENILRRHPFPGPGLAIRCLGEVTEERLTILRQADKIYIDALKREGLYDKIWQAGVILLPVSTVGVMGDNRTYESVAALRAVTSADAMTADWYTFEHDFLARLSTKIINEVKGINRVVYDVSTKPPATIEWE